MISYGKEKEMGGRGTVTPLGQDIGFFDESGEATEGRDMHVAPYNPQSGYKEIDPVKTLAHVETGMEVLDHEQMFLMNDEGYILSAVDGEKGSVGITFNAVRNCAGNVMTHNHPRKGRGESGLDGGTFSAADIRTLRLGMREMRAVGSEGTYCMKATSKANPEGFYEALYRDRAAIVRRQQEIAGRVEYAYEKGRYKNKHEAKVDSANQQMQEIHRWYGNHAQEYGYNYSFIPASEREDVTVTPPKRRTQKEIDRDNSGINYGKHKAELSKKNGVAAIDREQSLRDMGFEKQPDGTMKHPKTGQVVELFRMTRK